MIGSLAIPPRAAVQPVPVVFRQVFFEGRISVWSPIPLMGCDQCALAEDLYPIGGVNHLYLFSGIGVRGAVVVFVFADLNMTGVAYGQTGILLVLEGTLVPAGKLFMNPLIKCGEPMNAAIAKST